jgi:DNA adenine methylase
LEKIVKKLRPVFKCHGGKYYLAEWVISFFPANFRDMTYVEPCIGGGSVFLNKEPSKLEVINDIDPEIFNIYNQLKHNSRNFIFSINQIKYAEESFNNAKNGGDRSQLQQSVADLVVRRMSRGGLQKTFSWSKRLRGGRPGDENAWETFKEELDLIAERVQKSTVRNLDIMTLIDVYDSENTFFYIDPPYLHETRTAKNAYSCEMTKEKHIELLELINKVKGKVLISGYDSELYRKYLAKWNFASKEIVNHSSQAKEKENRTECLWYNYNV